MTKRAFVKPTVAELAILRVLWERGPSTVREVTEVLHDERGTGYTTTLKLLQIMIEKGLVRRNDSARSHVYETSVPAETTQRHLLADLLDKAFGGSTKRLVMQALSSKRAGRQELAEIRRLLDQVEKRGSK
jgi:predicted transcriptional regulator